MELLLIFLIAVISIVVLAKNLPKVFAPKTKEPVVNVKRTTIKVSGTSNYQDALADIVGGKTEDGVEHQCTAKLRRDPNNQHDPNAIAVLIGRSHVGYVPRATAEKLKDTPIPSDEVPATIVGGWDDGEGDTGSFGVRIEIPQSTLTQ